jgi:hypothetical protein
MMAIAIWQQLKWWGGDRSEGQPDFVYLINPNTHTFFQVNISTVHVESDFA